MNPVAFSVGPFEIRWYGILIVCGIILAIFLACRLAKAKQIDLDHLMNIFLLVVPFGIIGARIYYVIFEWSFYRQHPEEIIAIWHGGLAIHGGILAGLLVLSIYIWRVRRKDPQTNLSFRGVADLLAPGLILAQAIGRWGNFFNQEAYGYETTVPWAMYIDGAYRHPTFLYESLWDLCGFLILMLLWRRWQNRKEGDIMACYFIFYSCGRFVVESFRTDSLMLGPFRVAMLISLVGVLAGCLVLWLNRKYPVRLGGNTAKPQPAAKKQRKKK